MSLIINLFGAPGAGKSTTRAGIFYRLKLLGYNTEEVPEFAKDLTWEDRKFALGVQPYVFGKQLKNMLRVMGKVDIVITDSPVLLCAYYAEKYPTGAAQDMFHQNVLNTHEVLCPALNYYLRRVKKYNPSGRNQTEAESDAIGEELYQWLRCRGIDMLSLPGDEGTCANIVHIIQQRLSEMGIEPNAY